MLNTNWRSLPFLSIYQLETLFFFLTYSLPFSFLMLENENTLGLADLDLISQVCGIREAGKPHQTTPCPMNVIKEHSPLALIVILRA
jgi:hypothetical protein